MRAGGGALLVGALLACSLLVLAAPALGFAPELPPADLPGHPDRRCGVDCRSCEADGCLHCTVLLVPSSSGAGTCTSTCPRGSSEALAHGERHMGRVCYPDKLYSEVVVGGSVGALVCAVLAMCAVVHARLRRSSASSRRHHAPNPRAHAIHDANVLRLTNFHNQMDCLRPHAYSLLTILNNTRRQVRELYQFGNHEAALAYSCVLSDLAKLLLLLNKAQVPVVPDEWPRLFSWANKILRRYYYLSSAGHQGLASFVHPPAATLALPTPAPSMCTFKPTLSGSSMDLNDDSLDKEERNSLWDDHVRPPSYSLVPLAHETPPVPLTNAWDNREYLRRTSIWLEDELFQSGRRPQDELTTEL